jgi:hypothetical protein
MVGVKRLKSAPPAALGYRLVVVVCLTAFLLACPVNSQEDDSK